ncbi:hypothetical protein [Rahnella aceris]|uniref:4-oxalocrotonate tautomerase n=1 Tax=Rahnella sp. (strain Y9602) TaxID=2703885 RepID=A0ABW6CIJ8_RAHSY
MSTKVIAAESLSAKSDDIISALQTAIKEAADKNSGGSISVNVLVNPTPQGWEICIGNWCIPSFIALRRRRLRSESLEDAFNTVRSFIQ